MQHEQPRIVGLPRTHDIEIPNMASLAWKHIAKASQMRMRGGFVCYGMCQECVLSPLEDETTRTARLMNGGVAIEAVNALDMIS